MVIINPRVGDKVAVSSTDSTLEEYHQQWLESSKANKSEDGETESAPPAKWKFYEEKANDEHYKLGFRITITLQKVCNHPSWSIIS